MDVCTRASHLTPEGNCGDNWPSTPHHQVAWLVDAAASDVASLGQGHLQVSE